MSDPTPLKKQPARPPFREIGGSGLKAQAGFLYEEFRQELTGQRGVEMFKEMSLSAILGTILFIVEQIIQQVEWSVSPFSEDAADEKPRQFIEEAFDDMSVSWADTLSEILTFLTYGWAWLEVNYKMRKGTVGDPSSKFTDGKVGWRKWALRGQDTLYRWEFGPDGSLTGMTQHLMFPAFQTITVPIEKSLLFRTRIEKNNPEGLSILRRAYVSYYYAKRMQEIEAVGIERDLAGLPVITPPEGLDLWNPQDPVMVAALSQAESVVKSLRRGEREGVVKPFGWTLELLTAGGRRNFDLDATIKRYETRMAMTCAADFIFLGSGRAGSWALSSDKTELFLLAIEGYLKRVTDIVNTHAIPNLLELNGMDTARPPILKHGDIETQNLQVLGAYIKDLTDVGAITFPDPALEEHLRLAGRLPEAPEEPLPPVEGPGYRKQPPVAGPSGAPVNEPPGKVPPVKAPPLKGRPPPNQPPAKGGAQ